MSTISNGRPARRSMTAPTLACVDDHRRRTCGCQQQINLDQGVLQVRERQLMAAYSRSQGLGVRGRAVGYLHGCGAGRREGNDHALGHFAGTHDEHPGAFQRAEMVLGHADRGVTDRRGPP